MPTFDEYVCGNDHPAVGYGDDRRVVTRPDQRVHSVPDPGDHPLDQAELTNVSDTHEHPLILFLHLVLRSPN